MWLGALSEPSLGTFFLRVAPSLHLAVSVVVELTCVSSSKAGVLHYVKNKMMSTYVLV